MKESDLNTIITNSFKYHNGVANKIADPRGGTGIQNPFDGFGAFNGLPLYWEAKLIKNEFNAFAFSKIEPHQIDYLKSYASLIKTEKHTLYIIGYFVSRKIKGVFVFDSNFIHDLIDNSDLKSISKKQLQPLIKRHFININYIEVDGKRKEIIEFDKGFEEKIITKRTFDENQR